MTALDYILDGLEAELALERELGVRFIECDRALLTPVRAAPRGPLEIGEDKRQETRDAKAGVDKRQETRDKSAETRDARRDAAPKGPDLDAAPKGPDLDAAPKGDATFLSREPNCALHSFVFLHHREMGAQETDMMAKIVAALGSTLEAAPIVFEKPIPKAKVYVVLGQRALTKFFPDRKAAFDSWFDSEKGKPILFTRAPADVLRFKEVTPAVKAMKAGMWLSLKGLLKRV